MDMFSFTIGFGVGSLGMLMMIMICQKYHIDEEEEEDNKDGEQRLLKENKYAIEAMKKKFGEFEVCVCEAFGLDTNKGLCADETLDYWIKELFLIAIDKRRNHELEGKHEL